MRTLKFRGHKPCAAHDKYSMKGAICLRREARRWHISIKAARARHPRFWIFKSAQAASHLMAFYLGVWKLGILEKERTFKCQSTDGVLNKEGVIKINSTFTVSKSFSCKGASRPFLWDQRMAHLRAVLEVFALKCFQCIAIAIGTHALTICKKRRTQRHFNLLVFAHKMKSTQGKYVVIAGRRVSCLFRRHAATRKWPSTGMLISSDVCVLSFLCICCSTPFIKVKGGMFWCMCGARICSLNHAPQFSQNATFCVTTSLQVSTVRALKQNLNRLREL